MPTGKIILITRAYNYGTDKGEIQDIQTGKRYRFESPTNAFQMGDEVNYAPVSGAELKPMGMVTISRKEVNY